MGLLAVEVFSGLVIGAVYSLVALGLTVMFAVSKQLQLAQGDVAVVGAYVGYLVARVVPNLAVALVAAAVVCGLIGLLLEVGVFRWLRGPHHTYLVAGLMISALIEEILFLGYHNGTAISYPVGALIGFKGSSSVVEWIVVGAALALGAVFEAFMTHTKWGRALRATADDPVAARLQGVPVEWMVRLGFVVGSALGGVAGVLLGLVYQFITPGLGIQVGILAIAAVLFGGLGSVKGCVIGAFVLGLVQVLASAYISSGYAYAIAFLLIIVVVRFRPHGLFGVSREARA
ncbi:MAG: branched-chain amino acid ABC transporter permease [Candidatus Dormibacteria bacterium]